MPRQGLPAILMILSCLPAQAMEVPSPQAQQQMLGLMEQRALYRDAVDWLALRAEVAQAQGNPVRLRSLLDDAINRSSKGHGRWISPRMIEQSGKRAGSPARPEATPAAIGQGPAGVPAALDSRLGWVSVGRYSDTLSSPPAQQFQQRIQHAIELQARIRSVDSRQRCGWIVDLRGNSGGNMWPMLLGIEAMLRVPGEGAQVIGMLHGAGRKVLWESHDGGVKAGGKDMLGFGQPGYHLRDPGAPVAVLLGGRTASSGEAVALAFRGRPGTRSFGAPTSGFSTSNTSVKLEDGTTFLLTDSVMADRTGKGDGSSIMPDEATADEVATLRAASQWLLSQPACMARAEATGHARVLPGRDSE